MHAPRGLSTQCQQRFRSPDQRRALHFENSAVTTTKPAPSVDVSGLPWTCPGCGAYSQTRLPGEAGFYTTSRKAIRTYLVSQKPSSVPEVISQPVSINEDPGINQSVSQEQGVDVHHSPNVSNVLLPPRCDRCHNLLHHHTGQPIVHPTLQSMQEIIADSPHSYNHVYHVLDAADFPMSLIPKIQQFLALAPQRGRNRRAAVEKYYKGRKKAELSFIISRADLLAPTKQQVDMLMPYLTEVLRDALGSLGQGVRLGNVYCVSSHRGWWTKKVKDDIWDRGGGSWIVGKVNVGKSSLLENVFPKARSPDVDHGEPHSSRGLSTSSDSLLQPPQGSQAPLSYDSIALLLPPVPQETPFPVMPTVSHLPGTTALPIRLPFGQGRGEVIDLPGLSRGNLADFVLAEHRDNLVMKHRIKAKQLSIKPGQSLVVSNILRITPVSPDVVFLACPFVPIDCHVTNTEKAKAIVSQDITTAVTNIASPEAPEAIAHAGTFKLKWDTTKDRSGPLTAPSAAGLNASRLPFIIYSTDILIEGVGWIELAAQVRRRNIEAGQDTPDEEFSPFPEVEIYSPNGSHVAQRPPMNGWLLGGRRRPPVSQRTSRPRRSMRGVKKMLKAQKRAAIAASSTS